MLNFIKIIFSFFYKEFYQNIYGHLHDKKRIVTKNCLIKSPKIKKKLKFNFLYISYLKFQKNLKINQLEYINLA